MIFLRTEGSRPKLNTMYNMYMVVGGKERRKEGRHLAETCSGGLVGTGRKEATMTPGPN